MTTPTADFDAAKAVAEQLKGMDKERQERVLRWVAESLNLALGLKTAAGALAPSDRGEPAAPGHDQRVVRGEHRPVDIKTFVDAKRPKSDVQFAAVVAYYYRFEAAPDNRKETIDAKVLQDAARLAGRRRPPKPLVTLNNAKTLGYLDAPARGQFQINTVGENLVAMTLPGGERERARQVTKRRAKGRKDKAPKR